MAMSEKERAEIVRRIVDEVARRTLGPPAPPPAPAPPGGVSGAPPPTIGWTSAKSRPLLTADELREVAPGSTVRVPEDAVLTPLARDVASDRRISLVPEKTPPSPPRP